MDKYNINKLQNLYNKGFKCIKYEDEQQGSFVAYFKNFEEEKIDEIRSSNKKESEQLKSFIDNESLH